MARHTSQGYKHTRTRKHRKRSGKRSESRHDKRRNQEQKP